ncbi:MAG: hypothetical protein GC185_13245 [Alphaproteobacteria bacterium]|nr:hypothetical protein [Alphaproteobacteria bacterium]
MTEKTSHKNPTPEDWRALDPGAETIALVGPVAAGKIASPIAPHIAIDGGIDFAPAPLLWAGDGDSGVMPEDIPAFLKPTQEETDLRFCLNGIRAWRWQNLHLYGFLGGRRDHELANLGEVHAEMLARPAMVSAVFHDETDAPRILFRNRGAHELELTARFSLLALAPVTVSIAGKCEYPAENLALSTLSGQGISNIGRGAVTIVADAPFGIIL